MGASSAISLYGRTFLLSLRCVVKPERYRPRRVWSDKIFDLRKEWRNGETHQTSDCESPHKRYKLSSIHRDKNRRDWLKRNNRNPCATHRYQFVCEADSGWVKFVGRKTVDLKRFSHIDRVVFAASTHFLNNSTPSILALTRFK